VLPKTNFGPSIVRRVGEGGLINVKDPNVLAILSEFKAANIGGGDGGNEGAVLPILSPHHVVAYIPLALLRDRLPAL